MKHQCYRDSLPPIPTQTTNNKAYIIVNDDNDFLREKLSCQNSDQILDTSNQVSRQDVFRRYIIDCFIHLAYIIISNVSRSRRVTYHTSFKETPDVHDNAKIHRQLR